MIMVNSGSIRLQNYVTRLCVHGSSLQDEAYCSSSNMGPSTGGILALRMTYQGDSSHSHRHVIHTKRITLLVMLDLDVYIFVEEIL